MADANGSLEQATANLHIDEVTGESEYLIFYKSDDPS